MQIEEIKTKKINMMNDALAKALLRSVEQEKW